MFAFGQIYLKGGKTQFNPPALPIKEVDVFSAKRYSRVVKNLVFMLALLVVSFSTSAYVLATPNYEFCGDNSRGIDYWSYTFEPGVSSGRIPGHAYIAFAEPLPSNYEIRGGGNDYWKSENGYSLFLVNDVPWNYTINWYVVCADRIWSPYG